LEATSASLLPTSYPSSSKAISEMAESTVIARTTQPGEE
jgi:hypothetical protein